MSSEDLVLLKIKDLQNIMQEEHFNITFKSQTKCLDGLVEIEVSVDGEILKIDVYTPYSRIWRYYVLSDGTVLASDKRWIRIHLSMIYGHTHPYSDEISETTMEQIKRETAIAIDRVSFLCLRNRLEIVS